MLLLVEQDDHAGAIRSETMRRLTRRIDEIESEVNKMKVPASYGDQFYVLLTHINFVRNKLQP